MIDEDEEVESNEVWLGLWLVDQELEEDELRYVVLSNILPRMFGEHEFSNGRVDCFYWSLKNFVVIDSL